MHFLQQQKETSVVGSVTLQNMYRTSV